jgi:hypothetical protein
VISLNPKDSNTLGSLAVLKSAISFSMAHATHVRTMDEQSTSQGVATFAGSHPAALAALYPVLL